MSSISEMLFPVQCMHFRWELIKSQAVIYSVHIFHDRRT